MARRKQDDQSRSAGDPVVSTFQTRVHDYKDVERGDGDGALSAYAELYGRLERKLFADVAAGRPATSLKSAYLKQHGIPARMFNGVRVSLEGKVASVKEQKKLRVDSLGRRIARAEREIAKAVERGLRNQVHRKERRLTDLRSKQSALKSRHRGGTGHVVLRIQEVVAETASTWVRGFMCERCHYRWAPRPLITPEDRPRPEPKACPNCKSRYWNKPRQLARAPEHRAALWAPAQTDQALGKS